jgi:hypothetical protein
MFAVRYLKENGHKFLFGNAGSNEKNNCKPDHNRSELLCQWLVKYKYRVIHEKGTSEFSLRKCRWCCLKGTSFVSRKVSGASCSAFAKISGCCTASTGKWYFSNEKCGQGPRTYATGVRSRTPNSRDLEEIPSTCTRQLARKFHVSQFMVCRTLKEQELWVCHNNVNVI